MPLLTLKPFYVMFAQAILGIDPYWENVVLLSHCEGVAGASTFVDEKAHTITPTGTVLASTAKYGNTSAYFSGTASNGLVVTPTTDFAFGNDNFTIECWLYYIKSSTDEIFVDFRNGNGRYPTIGIYNSNGALFYHVSGAYVMTGGTVPENTWSHVALTRSNGVTRLFLNGHVVDSWADSNNYLVGNVVFGRNDGNTKPFKGYMDEIRVTKGVARYTADFVVPTAAFITGATEPTFDPYWDQTVLSIHGSASEVVDTTFVDASPNSVTVTKNGDAKQGNLGPVTDTGSIYFDGNGDYLTVPDSSNWAFGTGDFTVEFWVRPSAFYNYITIISTRTGINSSCWSIGTQAAAQMLFYAGAEIVRDPAAMTAGQWYHFAFVRNSGVITGYRNGVAFASTPNTFNFTVSSLMIGKDIGFGEPYTGYLSNIRITKGTAVYTSNFTPAAPLEVVAGTQLLLKTATLYVADNNTFIDSAGNLTVTRTGNVSQGAVSPFGAVGSSAYFDGNGDYLQLPSSTNLSLGTDNFTLEVWVNRSGKDATLGKYPRIINASDTWNTNSSWALTAGQYDWGWDKFGFHVYAQNANVSQMLQSQTTIQNGVWYHVAITRQGSTFRMFVNGVLEATATWAGAMNTGTTNTARIGGLALSGGNNDFLNGYLSNLRIIKGTALYTADFAVPTAPLTAVSGSSVLLNFAKVGVADACRKTVVETAGNSLVSTSGKYSTGLTFDGSTNYLRALSNNFAFGTGDFTVEAWVKFNNVTSSPTLYGTYPTSTATGVSWYVNATGKLIYEVNGVALFTGTTTLVANTWYHLALSRVKGVTRTFINGNLESSAADTTSIVSPAGRPIIGASSFSNGTSGFLNGFMDDLRISRVGRYQSRFTPKVNAQYTDVKASFDPYYYSDVLRITGGAGDKVDATLVDSVSGSPLTLTGTLRQAFKNPFNLSTEGSLYCNGAANYLSTSITNGLGAGDFTIEYWYYPTAFYNYISVFSTTRSTTGLSVGTQGAGQLVVYVTGLGEVVRGSTVHTLNAWNHVAVVRTNGVVKGYLNGTLQGQGACSNNLSAPATCIGGLDGSSEFLTGFVSNLRVVKGLAVYTANFTVPTSPLDNISGTALLVKAANSGSVFNTLVRDGSANSSFVTSVGEPSLGSVSPFVGQGGSCYFDKISDTLTVPYKSSFEPGAGDFTIECWINLDDISGFKGICSFSADYHMGLMVLNNRLGMMASSNGGAWDIAIVGGGSENGKGTIDLVANTWYHVAFVRSGTTLTTYVNGVVDKQLTGISSAILTRAETNFQVGTWAGLGDTYRFKGYISNFRYTVGAALYTASFTKPTTPLEAVTGTQLLLNFDTAGIQDATASSNIVPFGSVAATSAVKKYGNTAIAFNGTTGYLLSQVPSALTFAAQDFTIEAWVYRTDGAANRAFISKRTGATYCPIYSYFTNANQLQVYLSYSGTSWDVSGILISNLRLNAWDHIAIVRAGNTLYGYLNGVLSGTLAVTGSLTLGASVFNIGQDPSTSYFKGYMDNIRISMGVARYGLDFTPSDFLPAPSLSTQYPGVDLYWHQTIASLPLDALAGTTDLKGSSTTVIGSPSISTAQYKFGTASMLNGDGSGLSITQVATAALGSVDFTIECWAYQTTRNGTVGNVLFDWRVDNAQTANTANLWVSPTGQLVYYVANGTVANVLMQSGPSVITLNTWTHIAVTRRSGISTLYVNGQAVASATDSTVYVQGALKVACDAYRSTHVSACWQGHLQDFRITKGIARYAAPFNVPATANPTQGFAA